MEDEIVYTTTGLDRRKDYGRFVHMDTYYIKYITLQNRCRVSEMGEKGHVLYG